MSLTRQKRSLRLHAEYARLPAVALLASCDDPAISSDPEFAPLKTGVTAALDGLKNAIRSGNDDALEPALTTLDGAVHALALALRGRLESLLPKPDPSSY